MTIVNGNKAESYTDVLIIGAGLAGLMMPEWMAKCGINARIVDKRGTKVSATVVMTRRGTIV
jgi:2-polyprenyl-6-methoxyphenol hydroxylase-like FAD-dependent oxidoreductase